MSAPSASDRRKPLIANSDTSACSLAEASPGRDEQRAHLIPIQSGRVGLVVETRTTNVNRRGALEEPLLLGWR